MKHWIQAISAGLGQVWSYTPLIGWWYLLIVGWSLLVAYPVHHVLVEQVGHTLSVDQLAQGFDYTLWNDFKNAYGNSITPIVDQSILVLGLAALSLIFATGGTLATLLQAPLRYDGRLFWGQSAAFFWRLLRLTLLFWVLHGLVLGLFLALFYIASNGWAPFTLENEGVLADNFRWIAPLYGLALGFLFSWQDLSKYILVHEDRRWSIGALWAGLKLVLKRLPYFGSWMLAYGLVWVLVFWAGGKLQAALGDSSSMNSLLVLLLVSQLLLILRLTLKITHLAVVGQLYLRLQTTAPSDSSETL